MQLRSETPWVHRFDAGTSSWLDGHWSTATCGGIISCSTMVRSTSQAARPSARGCDTDKHDCGVWWNRHSQGLASFGFPCWNRGRERSDAIPRARGAHVDRWKTTVHSAVDTNHDHAPVGSKHSNEGKRWRAGNRGWPRNDPHGEVGQRAIWTCAQPAGLLFERRLETARQLVRPAQAWPVHRQAIVMRNARTGNTNSRTKNKQSLRRLPSVTVWMPWKPWDTSTGETARDDELPEDLWPNLNAMATRLQQLYIGNHEEKLTAREHGFDRDLWAGSPSD